LTLIEVLMATVILGTALVGLMQGMSQCLAAFSLARRVQGLQSVLGLGEIAHPMIIESDPVNDLAVDGDGDLADGYSFERECEDDEDEDDLYVLRTRVAYGRGGPGAELVVVRYIHYSK
jgi:hypothetical protein